VVLITEVNLVVPCPDGLARQDDGLRVFSFRIHLRCLIEGRLATLELLVAARGERFGAAGRGPLLRGGGRRSPERPRVGWLHGPRAVDVVVDGARWRCAHRRGGRPTAALDAEAEHAVFTRFRELAKGRTTIVISHRFPTVRMARNIVVLDHGSIVERGTHDELVAKGGQYAKMFALQAEGYR
jgi:hypothetical protein